MLYEVLWRRMRSSSREPSVAPSIIQPRSHGADTDDLSRLALNWHRWARRLTPGTMLTKCQGIDVDARRSLFLIAVKRRLTRDSAGCQIVLHAVEELGLLRGKFCLCENTLLPQSS